MKRSRTCLLSGAAVVAVMGNMQKLKSAEVEQKLVVNVCKSISDPSVLPAFVKAEWSNEQEAGGVTLKKLTLNNPDKVTDMTLVISAKDSPQQIGIEEYCFKFGKCSSEKLRVHFVFEGDGDKRILLPSNCHALFAAQNGSVTHSIDLSGVDTSRVTWMAGMFAGCENVRELDLRSFKMDHVSITGLWYMCLGCSKLKTLNISSFTQHQKLATSFMFKGSENLMTLCKIIEEDVALEEKAVNGSSAESVLPSSQPEIIEPTQNDGIKLENKITQEQKENLPNQRIEKSREVSHLENTHVKFNAKPEVTSIQLEEPNLRRELKDNKSILPTKSRIVNTKAQKENANPATVEVNNTEQKATWYTPIAKFCSWMKRTVLSWFK